MGRGDAGGLSSGPRALSASHLPYRVFHFVVIRFSMMKKSGPLQRWLGHRRASEAPGRVDPAPCGPVPWTCRIRGSGRSTGDFSGRVSWSAVCRSYLLTGSCGNERSSEQPSTGQLVSISARSARPGDATSSGGSGWLQRYVSVLRQAKLPPFRRTIVGRRLPSSRGGRPVVGPSFRTFLRSRTFPLRLECLGDCKADGNRPRTRVAAIPQSPAYSNAKAGRYQLPTIPIGWWRTLIVRRERGWAVNRGPT